MASVGLLFAGLVALGVSALCARTWYRLSQVQRRGVPVQAHLEGKDTVTGKTTAYRVHYRFQTPDGRTWQGTSNVGGTNRAAWEAAGPTVEVRYLAEDPSVNTWVVALPEDAGAKAAAVGLGLLGVLLLVAGVATRHLSLEQFERWWIEGRPS